MRPQSVWAGGRRASAMPPKCQRHPGRLPSIRDLFALYTPFSKWLPKPGVHAAGSNPAFAGVVGARGKHIASHCSQHAAGGSLSLAVWRCERPTLLCAHSTDAGVVVLLSWGHHGKLQGAEGSSGCIVPPPRTKPLNWMASPSVQLCAAAAGLPCRKASA